MGGVLYAAHVEQAPTECTLVGGSNLLRVAVPVDLRSDVGTIRVKLDQGSRSRTAEFVPAATNEFHSYVEQGVFLHEGVYSLALGGDDGLSPSSLGADWDPAERATAVVTGFGRDGRPAFRHSESFTFDRSYPNGKACDGEGYYAHSIAVTAADLD